MRYILTSQGFEPTPPQPLLAAAESGRRSWLKRFGALLGGGLLAGPAAAASRTASPQGIDPFIGEIMMVAFNFAPRGWALCNGQILSIAQNTALFSLLGVTYGGNGQTTFALPDLRGRVPLHAGQGPGLSNYNLGQVGGEEAHTLLATEMPAHTHLLSASAAAGTTTVPTNAFLANSGNGTPLFTSSSPTTQLNPAALGITGGSQPHNNMQPYLAINFCIALQGIYPSRP